MKSLFFLSMTMCLFSCQMNITEGEAKVTPSGNTNSTTMLPGAEIEPHTITQLSLQGMPIENLRIERYDQLGNLTGTTVTDARGRFKCRIGEEVSIMIGTLYVYAAPCQPYMYLSQSRIDKFNAALLLNGLMTFHGDIFKIEDEIHALTGDLFDYRFVMVEAKVKSIRDAYLSLNTGKEFFWSESLWDTQIDLHGTIRSMVENDVFILDTYANSYDLGTFEYYILFDSPITLRGTVTPTSSVGCRKNIMLEASFSFQTMATSYGTNNTEYVLDDLILALHDTLPPDWKNECLPFPDSECLNPGANPDGNSIVGYPLEFSTYHLQQRHLTWNTNPEWSSEEVLKIDFKPSAQGYAASGFYSIKYEDPARGRCDYVFAPTELPYY